MPAIGFEVWFNIFASILCGELVEVCGDTWTAEFFDGKKTIRVIGPSSEFVDSASMAITTLRLLRGQTLEGSANG